LIIASNGDFNLSSELDSLGFEGYEVIKNKFNVNVATGINQCLSLSAFSDYSIYINFEKSMILDPDWIGSVDSYIDDRFVIGGTKSEVKISNDNFNLIHQASKSVSGNLAWIEGAMVSKNVLECIDGNVFVMNNEVIKEVGGANGFECDDENFCTELSFRLLANGYELSGMDEVQSNSSAYCGTDLIREIAEGAEVICPVLNDSDRLKFLNKEIDNAAYNL